MTDKDTPKDRVPPSPHLAGLLAPSIRKESEAEEASCAAFGFLRGIRDRASTIEFRFRDGNTMWFPYSLLGQCRFDPSEGILLKFAGDLIYLILIRGSNLDRPINDGHMNLTSGGLQRQRITWVREMPEEDIQRAGEKAPTVDKIEVGEFETHAEIKEWLQKIAPAFAK